MSFIAEYFAAGRPEIDLGSQAGPVIGRGNHKSCFLRKDRPDRCLKVCGREDQHVLIREIRYRE